MSVRIAFFSGNKTSYLAKNCKTSRTLVVGHFELMLFDKRVLKVIFLLLLIHSKTRTFLKYHETHTMYTLHTACIAYYFYQNVQHATIHIARIKIPQF